MQINSVKNEDNKVNLSITFLDEAEERIFLQNILKQLGDRLPVNCLLTDLDTSYSMYEKYFNRGNYYVFDRLTTASIFAFNLNEVEIQDVLSNWGYFTMDALFALGAVDDKVKKQRIDSTDILKSLPVVIVQVLDNSIDIAIEEDYFEAISKFVA